MIVTMMVVMIVCMTVGVTMSLVMVMMRFVVDLVRRRDGVVRLEFSGVVMDLRGVMVMIAGAGCLDSALTPEASGADDGDEDQDQAAREDVVAEARGQDEVQHVRADTVKQEADAAE